jgi:hypothetical protein
VALRIRQLRTVDDHLVVTARFQVLELIHAIEQLADQ